MRLNLKRKQFAMYEGPLTKLVGGKPVPVVNAAIFSPRNSQAFRRVLQLSGRESLNLTPLSMGPKPVTLGGSSVLKSTWWRTNNPMSSNVAGLFTGK